MSDDQKEPTKNDLIVTMADMVLCSRKAVRAIIVCTIAIIGVASAFGVMSKVDADSAISKLDECNRSIEKVDVTTEAIASASAPSPQVAITVTPMASGSVVVIQPDVSASVVRPEK